jgi:hypothetical protein
MSSATERFYENLHEGVIDDIIMYRSEVHYCLAALKSSRVPKEVQDAAQCLTVEELYEILFYEGLLPTVDYDFIPRWYRQKYLTPRRKSKAQKTQEAKERAI